MNRIDFKDLPDTSTPLNAETFNTLQNNIESAINEVLNSVCPIGKVEIFFDNEDK